ncbi:MAG: serine/threonine-protein phosphatase, partial [Lachnospiraceae bacterium]|nr:serine/threonine-protein phosphatase [Lachnospiraceae bacterium]
MNKYICAYCSDVGIRKKTNQDSMLLKQIETKEGQIVFAVLYDGMGGMSKGELASATVIRDFD